MFRQKPKKQKIIMAMSGGVDSSTAAAILKKQGYEVQGVFMRFWTQSKNAKKDVALNDARNVAKFLKIPLRVIDARTKFKKAVVGYFLDEYKRGRTPNPCVFCNENMKFKILFEIMARMKADCVATGHYAKIISNSPNCLISNKITNPKLKTEYKLLSARDKDKDQSYFLYRLKQSQLSKIIFPLGELKKEEVRKKAKEFGLPVHDKKESQDVCFLASDDAGTFLRNNIRQAKGKIIDGNGNIVGEHEGLFLYTLGQRKGINIGGAGPYWVAGKDGKKNRLLVSNDSKAPALFSSKAGIMGVSWTAQRPKLPLAALVQTRYHNPLTHVIIEKAKRDYNLKFKEPQRAVTPGQSAVFYTKEREVLGGGIIR